MNENFAGTLSVQVHPSVLESGWAGLAQHHEAGVWEFHSTVGTLGEPLRTLPLRSLLDADPSLWQLESLPPMSQAWRWESGETFQKSHLPIGPTYFFHVEASPTEDHPDFGGIEGAVVNCWIRIASKSAAEELFHRELTKLNWSIDSIAEPEIHTEEDYEDDPAHLEYYEQAQTDGDVYVFYTYQEDDDA